MRMAQNQVYGPTTTTTRNNRNNTNTMNHVVEARAAAQNAPGTMVMVLVLVVKLVVNRH